MNKKMHNSWFIDSDGLKTKIDLRYWPGMFKDKTHAWGFVMALSDYNPQKIKFMFEKNPSLIFELIEAHIEEGNVIYLETDTNAGIMFGPKLDGKNKQIDAIIEEITENYILYSNLLGFEFAKQAKDLYDSKEGTNELVQYLEMKKEVKKEKNHLTLSLQKAI